VEKPFVTIGIPVRNCEETIEVAVDSIITQDYPHSSFQTIIVDDGCCDQTIYLARRKLETAQIQFRILSTGGKGLGTARQLIVDNSSGKYIVWVDGDMILFKDFVTLQVDFMEKNPGVWQARGKWEPHETKVLAEELENMTLYEYESRHTKTNRSASNLVGIGASICRRDVLIRSEGFDKSITGSGEDIEISAKMLEDGWHTGFTKAKFYHKPKTTWRSLWKRYFWYGYGSHYVGHKHKGMVLVWTRTPPAALVSGLLQAFRAYRTVRKKRAFLLPFQYLFKQTAWYFGFVNSHFHKYGHL
jgi:glycosyltransferase involved in cell wall biosynthesis